MATERRLSLADVLPRDPSIVLRSPRRMEEVVAAQPGLRVLDYGCGDAARRTKVRALGARYVGVDPFSRSADVVATGERLPFRDATFDVVLSVAVFEHVLDPAAGIAEIGRVLRPGGVLIGYSAFLESFHEISYHHLTHKALEHLFGLSHLRAVSLWPTAYGMDYQAGTMLVPTGRPRFLRAAIRGTVRAAVGATLRAQVGAHVLLRRLRGHATPGEYALRFAMQRLRYASGIAFEAVRT